MSGFGCFNLVNGTTGKSMAEPMSCCKINLWAYVIFASAKCVNLWESTCMVKVFGRH